MGNLGIRRLRQGKRRDKEFISSKEHVKQLQLWFLFIDSEKNMTVVLQRSYLSYRYIVI